MRVKITILRLAPYQKFQIRDAHKIRGYFANQFQQYNLLHNHSTDGFPIYRYPKVQYKILDDRATVLGINEGGEILENIYFDLKELVIDDFNCKIMEKSIGEYEHLVKFTEKKAHYSFLTPWLGLSEKNFAIYRELNNWEEKNNFCMRILTGNILTFLRCINFWVDKQIIVEGCLREIPVKFKNKSFIGFKGAFTCNIQLPDYIGLGKSPARGFGTIREARKDGVNSH